MSDYNDIKKQWAAREIPHMSKRATETIIQKSNSIRRKQRIGQIVLAITSVILILFFFYISAYKNAVVFLGLGIMIGSLLLRIAIEFFAMVKKENFPADRDMKKFNQDLITFYRRRKYIHYIVTPALFISYILGFVMLLPSFKESLSSGFYLYILASSVVIFIALAVLIGVQVRRELRLLSELLEE